MYIGSCSRKDRESTTAIHQNQKDSGSSGSYNLSSSQFSPLKLLNDHCLKNCGCSSPKNVYELSVHHCSKPRKASIPIISGSSTENWVLQNTLKMQTDKMEEKHRKLVHCTREEFKLTHTTDDITEYLNNYTLKKHQSVSENHTFAKDVPKVLKAKDMTELFNILESYWSWWNYKLLEELINVFGNERIRKELTDYKAALEIFLRNRLADLNAVNLTFGEDGESLNEGELMIVKVDEHWKSIHLHQLGILHDMIAKILDCNPMSLYLCSVIRGCIQLTFRCLKCVVEAVSGLTPFQKEKFRTLKVQYIQYGITKVNIASDCEGSGSDGNFKPVS